MKPHKLGAKQNEEAPTIDPRSNHRPFYISTMSEARPFSEENVAPNRKLVACASGHVLHIDRRHLNDQTNEVEAIADITMPGNGHTKIAGILQEIHLTNQQEHAISESISNTQIAKNEPSGQEAPDGATIAAGRRKRDREGKYRKYQNEAILVADRIDEASTIRQARMEQVHCQNPFPEHIWQKVGGYFPELNDILFHAELVAPFQITLSSAQDIQMLIRYLNRGRADCVRDICFHQNEFGVEDIRLIKRLLHAVLSCPISEGTSLQGALPSLLADLFLWASAGGHTEDVLRLLNDSRFDPAADNKSAFRWDSEDNGLLIELVRSIEPTFEDNHINGGPTIGGAAIGVASYKGHTEVVRLLLNDPSVDPAADNNYAIREASYRGHTEVVRLLLNDPRVDPAAEDNFAFGQASFYGCTEVACLLLNDPRVDPSADDNIAFRRACCRGHTAIVRLLLNDPRVDPTADNSCAMIWASESGRTEVVRLLLNDPRSDPATDNNRAISHASFHGRTEVVSLLLNDPRVDPAADHNDAIRAASGQGHTEVVRLLLNDPRVDPAAANNDALCEASNEGHTEVVRLLLNDSRVNAAARNNFALRWAYEQGHTEIVRLLSDDRGNYLLGHLDV